MPELTMIQALNLALHQEMAQDGRVIVLGEDVGIDGGVFRVTEGLLKTFGDERVLDTPLAESGIVGCAIGMALYGLRPGLDLGEADLASLLLGFFLLRLLGCSPARGSRGEGLRQGIEGMLYLADDGIPREA